MRKNNIFWISFSDLMTSLFFIMLVLFVLSIGYLHVKNLENERLIKELEESRKGLIEELDRVNRILNIEQQFAPLINDSSSFYYLTECNKFVAKDLMGVEIFNPNQFVIKDEFKEVTLNAGIKIEELLKELQIQNPDFSYLLVIEGNMANFYDKRISQDNTAGYTISYQRALAVYNMWLNNNINFRKYNVEVMICGSGFNGLCRDPIEENNKRFSIQIIPKVSK